MSTGLTVIATVAVAMLLVAMILGLRLIIRGPDAGSRAVVGDVVFFSAVGMVAVLGLLTGSAIVLDIILLASLVGILATIALARIITRGRR